ncbi:hypothetical protein [uncultured Pseudokineococcus sp.]|uniref:hypothetical protein n=1 Tax=uncultured Pseudokineococcus sp. TaxID=1642928 RepID=UPI002621B20F|nr:hypothetical protein [uncultured Pseudokineococcus sp.]
MTDEHVDSQLSSSLLGLLAVLEGEARAGQLPLDVALRLRQRLVRTRALPAGASRGDDLADGLADLNKRDGQASPPTSSRWPRLPGRGSVAGTRSITAV